MQIELKVDKEYFQKILSGDKTFEIRLGDRNFSEGDILVLQEKDPKTEKLTGREIEKIITYVRNTKDIKRWSKEEVEKYGLQIISFK